MSAQHIFIDSRFIVVAFSEAFGYNLDQVLIAVVGLCQQNQMPLIFILIGVFVMHGTRRRIDLAADDRFDALLLTLFVKVNDAEHDAVISDGKRIHAQFLCPRHHIGNACRTVQQAVFCMNM